MATPFLLSEVLSCEPKSVAFQDQLQHLIEHSLSLVLLRCWWEGRDGLLEGHVATKGLWDGRVQVLHIQSGQSQ